MWLAAGSVVAVVGESGAGKTTLVKLLTRCYEPTVGRITVEGVDIRRFAVDEWRRRLSAGFQDFVRFQEILQQSVGLGDLDRIDDPGRGDRRWRLGRPTSWWPSWKTGSTALARSARAAVPGGLLAFRSQGRAVEN